MPAATSGVWLPLTSPLSQGGGGLNARCFSPLLIDATKVRIKSEATKHFRNFFRNNYMNNSYLYLKHIIITNWTRISHEFI